MSKKDDSEEMKLIKKVLAEVRGIRSVVDRLQEKIDPNQESPKPS